LANGSSATCAKSELTEMMQALNIILPNPLAILTQETMKTFLDSKNAKYELVEQGTGITFVKQGLATLMAKQAALAHKEQSMAQVRCMVNLTFCFTLCVLFNFVQMLSNTEAELKSWKAKEKQLKKADEAQTLLEQLELEDNWVDVIDLENELSKLEKELEDVSKAKDGVINNIEKFKDKQAQLREQMRFLI
jgi:DNA repair exonuclease SbcCD ATPase subunit